MGDGGGGTGVNLVGCGGSIVVNFAGGAFEVKLATCG